MCKVINLAYAVNTCTNINHVCTDMYSMFIVIVHKCMAHAYVCERSIITLQWVVPPCIVSINNATVIIILFITYICLHEHPT